MGLQVSGKLGTRRIPFEEESCQGWRFLKQSNVPQSLHQGDRQNLSQRAGRCLAAALGMKCALSSKSTPCLTLSLKRAADLLLITDQRYLIEYPVEPIEPEFTEGQIISTFT